MSGCCLQQQVHWNFIYFYDTYLFLIWFPGVCTVKHLSYFCYLINKIGFICLPGLCDLTDLGPVGTFFSLSVSTVSCSSTLYVSSSSVVLSSTDPVLQPHTRLPNPVSCK